MITSAQKLLMARAGASSGSVGPNLSTASYDNISYSTGQSTVGGGRFKPDGTSLFVASINENAVKRHDLSTAWDLTTASVVSGQTYSATGAYAIYLKPDGTRFYYLNNSFDRLYQVDLSTAWDLTTGGTATVVPPLVGSIVRGLTFSSDGTKMYSADRSNQLIEQFNLSTAWDLTTAGSTPDVTFSVSAQASQPAIFDFNEDGTIMYVSDISSDALYQYSLTTAWDVSSASYSSISFSVASQSSIPYAGGFKSDYTKMYVQDAGGTIFQYSIS